MEITPSEHNLSTAPASSLNPSAQPSVSSLSTSSSQGSGSTGPTSSPGTGGVVVVGVIGRVGHEVSQLLDRLLDSHVFGFKKSSVWEQWHESGDQGVPSHSVSTTTKERKQRKHGHRIRDTEPQEDGVLEGEGRIRDSVANDSGTKRGSRMAKGHLGNGDYGRRKEGKVEWGRSEKGHGGSGDPAAKKEGQIEDASGNAGDEDLVRTWDGWMEGNKNIPWLLSMLKYHHDEEKGMVYVQFTCGALPLDCLKEDSFKASITADGLPSTLEHHEADGMRGLLFMFSVCHVILLVQEGAQFDPRFLRMFRLLQTAKHSLVPFVKTQVLPGLLPPPGHATRPVPLKSILPAASNASGRTGMGGRNSSTIALMSGSTPVLFPGQCTPVVLFVCLEDIAEAVGGLSPQATARTEDALEVSSPAFSAGPLNQFGNYPTRQNVHVKSATSGSTLLRANNKSEPGLRKKLQSSLEAQIRFLLKKCRTVAGSGDGGPIGAGAGVGMGPRGPGTSLNSFQGVGGGGAVFVLDPSRAVILLDRSANSQTDALDAAVEGIEAMLSGKQGLENVLWDLGSNSGTAGEDVQALRDFIWRQAEMFRGKGGISSNAAGGSAGVGMVAAAAAAAAASAASGGSGGTNKPLCNPPELPTFSSWLSACRVLAEALSARVAEEIDQDSLQKVSDGNPSVINKRIVGRVAISGNTGGLVRSKGTLESTLQCLESGADIDLKFSAAWCERVLPSAHDVYLKGLPPCYPTSLHKSQLNRSLHAFRSIVRGPAVTLYAEKLKKECEAVWNSGRQLCDAVSLTGKPCIHQVHDAIDVVPSNVMKKFKGDIQDSGKGGRDKYISKPHSSGVVFLHACACGRSRRLRKDPFDFESANVTFFRFPNCEDLLPSVVLPNSSGDLLSGGSPWSLVRLGNSGYYRPATGLLQSGFCPKQNFLSSWDIPILYRNSESHVEMPGVSLPKEEVVEFVTPSSSKTSVEGESTPKILLPRAQPVLLTKLAGVNLYSKVAEKGYSEGIRAASTKGISGSWKGSMGAATKAKYGGESAFPPLPQKQEKPAKQLSGKERKESLLVVQENHETNSKVSVNYIDRKSHERLGASVDTDGDHVSDLKGLGSFNSKLSLNSVTEHVRLYIGFEHECPHGHRFLLSQDQKDRFGPSNVSPAGVRKQENGNVGRFAKHKKFDRNDSHTKDSLGFRRTQDSHSVLQDTTSKSSVLSPNFPSKWAQKETKAVEDMQYWSVQDGHGDGLSLLNSNLPIYMHCPYCKTLDENKRPNNKGVVFGGTISQLQRIFLVTPSLPLLLASCPVVEFEDVSKPVKTIMEFKLGSEVVLPPDSFLSLRLPFVYYGLQEGAPQKPFVVNQNQPEQCAWLVKNTALYILSKGGRNGPSGG